MTNPFHGWTEVRKNLHYGCALYSVQLFFMKNKVNNKKRLTTNVNSSILLTTDNEKHLWLTIFARQII